MTDLVTKMEEAAEQKLHRVFNRAQIDDRQINELLGLAQGITADGLVTQLEAEFLQKWLVKNTASRANPVIGNLLGRVQSMLADGNLDAEESRELMETLQNFAGGDFELGELQKSTKLPLETPPQPIIFQGKSFCFTGTFAYGSRKACEQAVTERGGKAGSLTMGTDCLVIGVYATDSWAHSSYGRKIEKAVDMQQQGKSRIRIVGELHWHEALG